jgi:hypothetical protein
MRRIVAPSLALAALLAAAGCQHANTPATPSTPPPPATASAPAPAAAPAGYAAVPPPRASPESNYVFGWGDLPAAIARPRGGSTQGSAVTLAPGRPLPLPEIADAKDAFARDRAAILALAGDYKVSFHFMESLGLATDYKPIRPYHSWATEHVRVLEDTGRFISLQHTLVMFFKNPDGTASEPMLTKHWRQDWTYEDTDLHTFRGAATWARRRVTSAEATGAWSQAVFQVDDSPRYEALGRWEHRGNLSTWTSERAWRPLPRREHTVRKDYDVMEGVHRIVLTSTGWLHEQNNWKRVAGERPPASSSASFAPSDFEPPGFVAAEIGLDRYERMTAPSLAPADVYWKKTGAYWALVRRAWAETFAQRERFILRDKVDGQSLFEHHFAYAEKLESGQPFDATDAARHARSTIERFLGPTEKSR